MKINEFEDFIDETDEVSEYFAEGQQKGEKVSPTGIIKGLDYLYQKSLDGFLPKNKSVEEIAQEYLNKKDGDVSRAAKAMLNTQVAKCTASGFVTGFGGVFTMPVTLPVNAVSVLYYQIWMIQCTAYMGGFDPHDDQVQTFIFACLAGLAVSSVIKKTGVKLCESLARSAIEKIPDKVLTKINQKVGFKLISKFSEKGLIKCGRIIPFAGAGVNAAVDLVETKIIANRAYKMFIEKDFSVCDKKSKKADEIDVVLS
ncbi:MAG: EcsC family protein [Oscillospiraceae bacterium]|nr:EcsC family protein [Oscillospiraceae bacterium]